MTLNEIRDVDVNGMYDHLVAFPEMWRKGWEASSGAQIPISIEGCNGVVVTGMGGSAIGGDVLAGYLRSAGSLPVEVARSYSLPGWVGPSTVVIVSSYSGNTEEALSAYADARARGARICCVTTGGKLAGLASADSVPVVSLPAGVPPRAALPFSFTAVLAVAHAIGLAPNAAEDQAGVAQVVEEMVSEMSDPNSSQAAQLAANLEGLMPVIYTSDAMNVVGIRWAGQIQENGKTLAFHNAFPELNHNEIVGWDGSGSFRDKIALIFLRDAEDHDRVKQRMEITSGLIRERAGYFVAIDSKGQGFLARMMSLIYLGDWLSLYLAVQAGVDPSPVALIDKLKSALADA